MFLYFEAGSFVFKEIRAAEHYAKKMSMKVDVAYYKFENKTWKRFGFCGWEPCKTPKFGGKE